MDITVQLEYLMPLEKYPPFEMMIDNEDRIVSDPEDFLVTAMKYL